MRSQGVSSIVLLASMALLVGCSNPSADDGGSVATSEAATGHHGGGGETGRETIVVEWNEAAIAAIARTGAAPTVAARALAEMHTAAYDAWTAYSDAATPTQAAAPARRPAKERTTQNKRVAVSYASFRVLTDLFPGETAVFQARLADFGLDPKNVSVDPSTPAGVGNAAAAAVIAFRHQDASNQLGDITPGAYSDYTMYAPVNTPTQVLDPSRWQPLLVPDGQGGTVAQSFVTPQWQNVLPFALTDPAQFRPAPPAQYGTQAYIDQAKQILAISAALTDRRKMVAEYWSDGVGTVTPAGHWAHLAQFVSARDRHGIDDDVKMFFALSNALLDASIAVWEAKRFYDSERPITAIHVLFTGKPVVAWAGPYKGTRTIDGGAWRPYEPGPEPTPASPEHPSEESAFAAAAAEVLRLYTGNDAFGASHFAARGSSRVEPGRTPRHALRLCWPTFDAAARQAARATLYRGVHFDAGEDAGRAMGRAIGDQAWQKATSLFHDAQAGCHRPPPHFEDCDADDDDNDDDHWH